MTKFFYFALKIKGGGREGGTCEVLRPCHPPPTNLERALGGTKKRFLIKALEQFNHMHCISRQSQLLEI